MLGMKFILDQAGDANMPVVILIGLGSNFGGHNGDTLLERYITGISQRTGIVCVAAAGNEGNMRHHAEGVLPAQGATDTIPINMRENIRNVAFHVTSETYDRIAVEVVSPAGSTTGRLAARGETPYENSLPLGDSTVTVRYYEGSSNVALISIQNPTPGIWNVLLHGDSILNGGYHAWLPLTGVVNPGVEFLKPSPNCTVVMPATAERVICVGAYSSAETSLFVSSSWGPTARPRMAPDFVAPGVNVKGVYPSGYGAMTGTSAAAAVTAGACAMLLEWGIVNGKDRSIGQEKIRALLISGSTRKENITFPNPQWGFGTLNLLNVFGALRG
jgi:subtilisin family serine protease